MERARATMQVAMFFPSRIFFRSTGERTKARIPAPSKANWLQKSPDKNQEHIEDSRGSH